jgi:hypothetical protein
LEAALSVLESHSAFVLERGHAGQLDDPVRKCLMITNQSVRKQPFTLAVRQALQNTNNSQVEADLLFLEAWEMYPSSNLGLTLKASQIRRANPGLAAAIVAELRASPATKAR